MQKVLWEGKGGREEEDQGQLASLGEVVVEEQGEEEVDQGKLVSLGEVVEVQVQVEA